MTTSPLPASQLPVKHERIWPALIAFLTAWLLPATTARRIAHISLIRAYGIHLLAAVLMFPIIIYLIAFDNQTSFIELLGEIIEEFEERPGQSTLVMLIIVAAVELGFLFLALLMLPWGACDERLRSSWTHALRQTWLHTTHFLPLVFLIGLASIQHDRMRRAYWQSNNNPQPVYPSPYPPPTTTMPTPPAIPMTGGFDTPEMKEYEAAYKEYEKQYQAEVQKYQQTAMQQYQKKWKEYRARIPFLVKYGEAVIVYCGFASTIWILWALLRAVGIRRQTTLVIRDPICEFCGYNLTGTAADSRCPECGEFVITSLGDDVRSGSLWDRRHEVGWWRAWWRCCIDAVFQSKCLGRQIRINPTSHPYRGFLAMHLVPIFLICGIGIVACFAIIAGADSLDDDGVILWGVAPLVGYYSSLSAWVLTLLSASLIGMIYTAQQKRNLLPATLQIASYLCGYMVVWSLYGSVSAVFISVLYQADVLETWGKTLHIDVEMLAFDMLCLLNLPWLGVYLYLVWQGTSGARYANR